MATFILSEIFIILLVYINTFFQHRVIASVTTLGANVICNHMDGLVSKQRKLCNNRPDVMVFIGQGAEAALQECKWQFRKDRWNCSHPDNTTSLLLGNNLPLGSKEAGFAISIKSAGIAHYITQACSSGSLQGCSCDKTKKEGTSAEQGWKWGGCSADINYGLEFAKVFVDANDTYESPRSLMNLHNSRAGRQILKNSMKMECKCHGPSGSCAVKTCWITLPTIREVGQVLKNRYLKAKKVLSVQLRKHHKKSLKLYRSKRSEKVSPRKADLVFLEDSPNYCDFNLNLGSLGTTDRQCNKTSLESDGCDLLCCGRGYNKFQHIRKWQCDCKFHWCCHVTCNECSEKVDIYTCK